MKSSFTAWSLYRSKEIQASMSLLQQTWSVCSRSRTLPGCHRVQSSRIQSHYAAALAFAGRALECQGAPGLHSPLLPQDSVLPACSLSKPTEAGPG